ncbi:uridine kinase [Terriglobus saanensis]|uniref:uridine/cytidine kinase n=1 Tax=Terriglobus saanensis (strain ATCC BAA-1853 / DSM 23119 / SP1PR4) TaxID=401053 RepID=E8V4S9_TERSS|nr:uridine kinase [Terriglobus saanensis]ADV81483.1 putative uridine kinase [Terriglobus saanensis SP1PR4]
MEQLTLGGIVRPVIVGIAGCSGSGKTTLARELALELEATLFPFDYYYRDLAHLPLEERAHSNFDHPDSLESELLLEHLEMLAMSKPISRPIYDFATHTRVPGKTERVEPAQVILVEGILALHYVELRGLFDFSIYVDAPHEVCLMRRIHRDVRERGRTEASVKEQFEATALPMAERYVLPSREFATLTVQGTDSLDWSVEQVLSRLHARGLR